MSYKLQYKIQNDKGLYSLGGKTPSFNKTGKLWKIGHLKTHILGLRDSSIYDNCILVSFEIITTETITETTLNLSNVISDTFNHNIEICRIRNIRDQRNIVKREEDRLREIEGR